jgi:hypothetical protein
LFSRLAPTFTCSAILPFNGFGKVLLKLAHLATSHHQIQ